MPIKIDHLSKHFKMFKREAGLKGAWKSFFKREYENFHALKKISLSIDDGEILGILGENGAGKTTLIKLLVGLLHPSSGKVDINGFLPWDRKTVLTSIQKTNRALVLHEANITGGIGAEIASIISEEAFESLDAPVKRVASLDTPIPFTSHIERNVYLPHGRFESALRELLEY